MELIHWHIPVVLTSMDIVLIDKNILLWVEILLSLGAVDKAFHNHTAPFPATPCLTIFFIHYLDDLGLAYDPKRACKAATLARTCPPSSSADSAPAGAGSADRWKHLCISQSPAPRRLHILPSSVTPPKALILKELSEIQDHPDKGPLSLIDWAPGVLPGAHILHQSLNEGSMVVVRVFIHVITGSGQ
ncbi:hypothetical protein A6R68_01661 [Neotoma lepida]|uniref:Uncharacterized protein n=1 Tax=Neotoma lepida TaxID=56216 RepID=A0A1A6GTZ5_NEOLE|nr:hypothetical protein A6R68_01661 [Neotoma lepida]